MNSVIRFSSPWGRARAGSLRTLPDKNDYGLASVVLVVLIRGASSVRVGVSAGGGVSLGEGVSVGGTGVRVAVNVGRTSVGVAVSVRVGVRKGVKVSDGVNEGVTDAVIVTVPVGGWGVSVGGAGVNVTVGVNVWVGVRVGWLSQVSTCIIPNPRQ